MTDSKPKDVLEINDDIEWFLRDAGNAAATASVNSDDGSINGSKSAVKSAETTPDKKPVPSSTTKNGNLSPETSPKPHLTTTLSNSNDHIVAKTRPSIGTIQEEEVMSPSRPSFNRKKSNSVGSIASNGSEKESGGFLSKLKGKFHKSPPNSPVLSSSSVGGGLFKDNYRLSRTFSNTSSDSGFGLSRSISNTLHDPSDKGPGLTRSSSLKAHTHPAAASGNGSSDTDLDPKLDEYVKFYSQKSTSRPSSRKSSVSESSCLLNGNANDYNVLQQVQPQSSGSKLGSFLRRKSTPSTPALPLVSVATEYNRRSTTSPNVSAASVAPDSSESENSWLPNVHQYKQDDASTNELKPILPEFKDLKPLKRVAFHSSTFLIDPPQQIPSRNPRAGNVEVLPNGALKINPLTEEDKKAIEKSQMGLGGGIVVGGSGALHHVKKEDANGDAEYAHEHKEGKVEEEGSEDTKISEKARHLGIDKPMIHSKPSSYTVPVEKMALDLMYTRCCHLREILPIPAILKQIPKDSMAPLPILQLRNPAPTMVEIETFADFIRIAPIICISLDGVSLSYEQFKILLSAMSAKTQLLKLSLRNTPIDSNGWSLLCWFLSRNTVLNKLDITQCPSLIVNNFRKKKKANDKAKKTPDIVRMQCNKENRTDMDWALFTATLIARGGIEELILTGCCITDLQLFEKLLKFAVGIKTNRLGLAYNNLTCKHMEILLNHYLFKPFVRGLDLGFNDFSDHKFLGVLKEYKQKNEEVFNEQVANSQLGFLSLNSTNLRFSAPFKDIFEQFFIQLPNLKYLDMSNNVKLFNSTDSEISDSEITDFFCTKIPFFPKLVRLQLEHNNLSSQSIMSLANIFPFCQHLAYVSFVGNTIEPVTAAALIQGVKNSKIITLEADMDSLPHYFKDKLGLYTMKNMEAGMYPKKIDPSNNEKLADQLNEILDLKAKQKLDLDSPIVKNFLRQATKMRTEIQTAVNGLNDLQLSKQLTLEGKEALVRLIFIDSSIGKAIQLIDESFDPNDHTHDYDLSESKATDEPTDGEGTGGSDSLVIPENRTSIRSPGLISRTSSKTSLNMLDKEEGAIHKLNKKIDLQNTEELGLEELSGEEIRQKIRSVNLAQLDDIVNLVTNLKARGVSISTLFKDIKEEKDRAAPDEQGSIDINYITDKLRKMDNGSDNASKERDSSPGAEKQGTESDTSSRSQASEAGSGSQNQKGEDHKKEYMASPMAMDDTTLTNGAGEEVNEIFDQVLHDINSGR